MKYSTSGAVAAGDLEAAENWLRGRVLGEDAFNFVVTLKGEGDTDGGDGGGQGEAVIGMIGSRDWPEVGYLLHPGMFLPHFFFAFSDVFGLRFAVREWNCCFERVGSESMGREGGGKGGRERDRARNDLTSSIVHHQRRFDWRNKHPAPSLSASLSIIQGGEKGENKDKNSPNQAFVQDPKHQKESPKPKTNHPSLLLQTAHTGKGYATEALRALIPAFFTRMTPSPSSSPTTTTITTPLPSFNYIQACTDQDNLASQHVLLKCGFELVERLVGGFESPVLGVRDTVVFRLAREGTKLDGEEEAEKGDGGSGFVPPVQ